MLRLTKIIFTTAIVGTGLLAAGCQNNKPSPDATGGSASTEGIACDKCETTWVKTPTWGTPPGGKGWAVTGYSKKEKMVCPDCKSMVENMFSTGKMEHTCKACGGNMRGCAVH